MTESAQYLDIINASFPIRPVPDQFFWAQAKLAKANLSLDLDIPQELKKRMSGRPWTDVTLMDWRMTGTSPAVARRYLEPATFLYYVPSIILGVSREIDFIGFALEAIIPDNKEHVPRGKWWSEFSRIASPHQRTALCEFLVHVRLAFWDTVGPANQYLLERAENVWSSEAISSSLRGA